MTDEEMVRAAWEVIRVVYGPGNPHEKPSERLAYVVYSLPTGPDTTIAGCKQFEVWAVAAEFTRERQEQIRQLQEEIARERRFHVSCEEWVDWIKDVAGSMDSDDVVHAMRGHHANCRIRARLEAELAKLQQGMKEVA